MTNNVVKGMLRIRKLKNPSQRFSDRHTTIRQQKLTENLKVSLGFSSAKRKENI